MSTRRRSLRIGGLSGLILSLAMLGLGVSQSGKLTVPSVTEAIQPGFYPITHVSDGDTFSVRIAGKTEAVRMIGIDTPETKDPRKPVQCFGKAASNKAKELLQGKTVRLEADPASDDRDKYHRLLRYAYLSDGTFYNQAMVQQGYAFAYTIFPNSKLDQFRAWEREARQNKRLPGGCSLSDTGLEYLTQRG
jgi:endonuclease YncB( thermonuclease family)